MLESDGPNGFVLPITNRGPQTVEQNSSFVIKSDPDLDAMARNLAEKIAIPAKFFRQESAPGVSGIKNVAGLISEGDDRIDIIRKRAWRYYIKVSGNVNLSLYDVIQGWLRPDKSPWESSIKSVKAHAICIEQCLMVFDKTYMALKNLERLRVVPWGPTLHGNAILAGRILNAYECLDMLQDKLFVLNAKFPGTRTAMLEPMSPSELLQAPWFAPAEPQQSVPEGFMVIRRDLTR